MEIRLFHPQDAEQIAHLFHDTVRQINICDYCDTQVRAWAPDDIHFRNWEALCSRQFTYVACDRREILGFAQLEPNGHIDCFYCHKNYQRCGVGSQLYRVLEVKALELEVDRLFTEASITAKPFFQRMGFSVVTEQEVTRRGSLFINYVMEKVLKT
ncbi:MAG: GNAT family N-acetyltransferase [Geitlerinemataceae cyanobacterium]